MGRTNPSAVKRHRRKLHIRKKIFGTVDRPRMSVFKSAKHIYVQIINDEVGTTLLALSTLSSEFKEEGDYGGNKKAAAKVGALVGKKALEAGIQAVVFDRNGFLYHGRVKALADAAREAGLKF